MGCYTWYSEERTGRAHPSTAGVPITVLLYNSPLLCGFNVPVKGLNANKDRLPAAKRQAMSVVVTDVKIAHKFGEVMLNGGCECRCMGYNTFATFKHCVFVISQKWQKIGTMYELIECRI